MATGDRTDPFRGFNFRIELDNTSGAVAGFREASGLSFTTDPVEYREGPDTELHVRKLMGLRKYANITLSASSPATRSCGPGTRRWSMATTTGATARSCCATSTRTTYCGGSSCRAGSANGRQALNATTNEVALETIEICVERCDLV